jgi:hypothetical protein
VGINIRVDSIFSAWDWYAAPEIALFLLLVDLRVADRDAAAAMPLPWD